MFFATTEFLQSQNFMTIKALKKPPSAREDVSRQVLKDLDEDDPADRKEYAQRSLSSIIKEKEPSL